MFTPMEIRNYLNFGPLIPSSYSSHPLLSLLSLQAKFEKKSELLDEKGIDNIDDAMSQAKMTYAGQFTPQTALKEIQKESLFKVGGVGAYFFLSSYLWSRALPKEASPMPILQPISGGKFDFASWKSALLSKRRFGSLLLVAPLVLLSIQLIDPWIKKLKSAEPMILNDFRGIMMKAERQLAEIPASTLEYTRREKERDIQMEKENRLIKLKLDLIGEAQRPSLWLGGTVDDPFTKERAEITLFYRPLTDAITLYGFFLKTLLSYTHPIVAHLVTALLYTVCRPPRGNEDPDFLNVLRNFSFVEAGISQSIGSLLQQSLYHVAGGSIALPYLLGLIHRGYYYFTQEVFSSATVTPLELSPFALKIIRLQSQLFSVIRISSLRMNERAAEGELWDNLFFNPDKIVRFPKSVLDEVPNAYDIVFQFSNDILLEYGHHDSEETVFTIDDICSCLLRLEHYKRQYIPSARSVPLFFIDEEVLTKLLLVDSPLIVEGRLAAMLEDSPPLFHVIQAQLLAMKDPTNKQGPLNSVTNRLSYLSYVQPSFAESELSLLFYFLTKESIDYPGFNAKSDDLYSIQMKEVSSLMRAFYLSKLQDLYAKGGVSGMLNPKGKVSRSEFFNLIHAYFATMESKTMIEELKKIERARNNSSDEKNLHSYMKYYNLSAPSSLKNKEEFLKIVEAAASSVQIADAAFFQAMEPLLFRELISSFICRPVAFLQSSHLLEVTNVMRARKDIFVNRLLQYQSIVRAQNFESALSEYGLTSTQFQHLVNVYAPRTPEVAALLAKWEDYYDPKPSYFKKPSHQDAISKVLLKNETRRLVYEDGNTLKILSSMKRN